MQITFTLDRPTKTTMRFAEVVDEGQTAVVGTLYVKNDAYKDLGSPETLSVTIEA